MIRKNIPNAVTLIHLAIGFVSILFSINGDFTLASTLILVAVGFDYLDGKLARMFNAESKMGEMLDSLADLVSFGIAPGVLMFSFFKSWLAGAAFVLLVVAGTFRLARYNVNKSKIKGFQGMPITMNGIIFPILYFLNVGSVVVIILTLLSSILMICRFRIPKVIR